MYLVDLKLLVMLLCFVLVIIYGTALPLIIIVAMSLF